MKFIYILFICVIVSACERRNPKTNSDIENATSSPMSVTDEVRQKNYSNNTYNLQGKSIIFFMITQNEFDSLMNLTENDTVGYEINDSIADFSSYANLLIKKLYSSDIKAELSESDLYKIKTSKGEVVFDRRKNKKMFGVIMSDGAKDPLIKEGLILKIEDYRKLINDYFGLDLLI